MAYLQQLSFCFIPMFIFVISTDIENSDPVSRQLLEYRTNIKVPQILTTTAGKPVSIREVDSMKTDVSVNQYFLESIKHLNREEIPARTVHSKGTGAFGYFEVTNDVSTYCKAKLFSHIGKRTPIIARFSFSILEKGEPETTRDQKGFAVKFYTEDGNLDFTMLNAPVFSGQDPIEFISEVHASKPNPKTGITDYSALWDLNTNLPRRLHNALWEYSAFGNQRGFRKSDYFPIHTFEINNDIGKQYFVRFNFRTQQGIEFFTPEERDILSILEPNYFSRDLYNSIKDNNHPSWTLEMDVLTLEDLNTINYDPFDVTRLWKNGTFKTVTIGKIILNKNPENLFRAIEQAAFNPHNLVPGISGPHDVLFRGRLLSYVDAQMYRLGVNYNNIKVNKPFYAKTYYRDGNAPVNDNGNDAPNYYPNTFNGPLPLPEHNRSVKPFILLDHIDKSPDFESISYFYNNILKTDSMKQILADNIGKDLAEAVDEVVEKTIYILTLMDEDLGNRVYKSIHATRIKNAKISNMIEPSKNILQNTPTSTITGNHLLLQEPDWLDSLEV